MPSFAPDLQIDKSITGRAITAGYPAVNALTNQHPLKILGISAFYHDSAAALIDDGVIVAAAQEERFTRKKHDPGFPSNAVQFCLEYGGLTLNELDAIVFYDKPLLKFERLLETYYAFAPKGIRSFITAMPVWIKEKMFLKRLIKEELVKLGYNKKKPVKMLFPEHHLSHAASAFYPSPYQKAAILTIDGVGEWATASICLGEGKDITILKELRFPHSLGLLYSAFTYFLGFRVNSGEYKLMGLAPYGNPTSPDVERYEEIILKELIELKEDGSVWLNQKYFDYATGLKMVDEPAWEALFGFKKRNPEDSLEAEHCNLGLAIQRVTEEAVIRMGREAQRLTGADYLCMAGGVALNCVSNGKIQKAGIFKDIFIQPAAGDAGGALGAAQAAYHIYFGQERNITWKNDNMRGSYLGPTFSDLDVELTAKKYKATYTHFEDFKELSKEVAKLLADGNVVGWVQGRMEFGPRALGGRSILGDPRNSEMQKKLNLKIKYRESFRPFAPSVLAENRRRVLRLRRYLALYAAGASRGRGASPTPPGGLRLDGSSQQALLRAVGPALHYPHRLLGPHPDGAPGNQSALLGTHQCFQGTDGLRRDREHEFQRARRTHRLHAQRLLPLLHAHRNGLPRGRQLRLR